MLLLWGLACADRPQVVWDAIGSGDAVQDVVIRFVLFGAVQEGDRAAIDGPHVAGGALRMRVTSHQGRGEGWSVSVLEPAVASVEEQLPDAGGLEVALAFHRPGTTLLHVFDEEGAVIDVQRLEVRAPEAAELRAWEDLAAGEATPLGPELHLVAGTDASIAVSWLDGEGRELLGGGLLAAATVDGGAVSAGVGFDGDLDVLALDVPRDAEPGSWPLALWLADAAEPVEERAVTVHARSEVDGLSLASVEAERGEDGFTSGTVRAAVSAAGTRMLGAEVDWTWEGGEASGSVLYWDSAAGGPVEATACFADLCETIALPGTPTGAGDDDAPLSPGSCGCASSGAAGAWPWLGLAALGLRRRRLTGPARPAGTRRSSRSR